VLIIAIDTASELCSTALMSADAMITREVLAASRGHADRILPMMDELLADAGVRLRDVQAVAFGRGPGAFTGVRLAASIAQGLAFSTALPVVPVSDLSAVAQRALDLAPELTHVLVCQDARMQELYWGCFDRDPQGLAAPAGDERVSAFDDITLPSLWRGNVGAAGRGFAICPELVRQWAFARVFDDYLPRAREIARLAWHAVLRGAVASATDALPVYVRDTVAQASRN
jgi:tRNA threonylcarbamoyladenosine biosynthesis protein TsaB